MVFEREVEPPVVGSPAGSQNGGRRLRSGPEPALMTAGIESLSQPLRSRATSLRGVGCTITLASHEGGSSWRCVVDLPPRMEAAGAIAERRSSRDEAAAHAFRRAETALGWMSTRGTAG